MGVPAASGKKGWTCGSNATPIAYILIVRDAGASLTHTSASIELPCCSMGLKAKLCDRLEALGQKISLLVLYPKPEVLTKHTEQEQYHSKRTACQELGTVCTS